MVRRHRRRRVRALGRRAVRRPPPPGGGGHGRTTRPVAGADREPSPPSPASRTATRPAWRSAAASSRPAPPPTTAPASGSRDRTAAPARVVYAHAEDAGVGALSDDETLLAISHSEHGDSRHPAVRVVRTADGSAVAEKSDGPGRGLTPLAFAPVPGDQRLLLLHERRGREELLIWDVAAGTETELAIDLPGELVGRLHPGRDSAARLAHPRRAHPSAPLRPRDRRAHRPATPRRAAWARPTSARTAPSSTPARRPPSRRPSARCTPTARTACCSRRPASPRPARCRSRTCGWTARAGGCTRSSPGRGRRPDPHPPSSACTAARTPPTRTASPRSAALWVDAGFVVVEVNYRGSTGYGSAWRDAIEGRPGLTELEDVAAVLDACVAAGIVDPAAGRRGGLVVGRLPGAAGGRHAARGAGQACWPASRWPTTSPRTPTRWSSCAPSTGRCSAAPRSSARGLPRVVAADLRRRRGRARARAGRGERPALPDPPDRQLPRRAWRPGTRPYEVSRFDAGHGSLVVEETMRHAATEVAFARAGLRPVIRHATVVTAGTNVCVMLLLATFVTHGDNDGVVPEEVASWRCGAFTWSWRTDRAGSASWPRAVGAAGLQHPLGARRR